MNQSLIFAELVSILYKNGMASRAHLWCALLFSLARLVLHLKRRTLLGPTLSPVIEPGRGNVGMPQPLLHPYPAPGRFILWTSRSHLLYGGAPGQLR